MGRRRKRSADELHGVLLVDKPRGITSFDVIRELRPILGQRSIGHSGTLDPMATGLLVLCLGDYTRFASWLTDDDKVYEATVTLGVTTESDDAEGEVLTQREVPPLSSGEIEGVLACFRGEQEQVPPAYSAIHVKGERAYELARRGETVELAARTVNVTHLENAGFCSPELRLVCHVSKGTYIRSLARDIGEALGCGAHLSALRRTRSGAFTVEQANAMDHLRSNTRDGLRELVLQGSEALTGLPLMHLDDTETERLRLGQRIAFADPAAVGVDYAGVDAEGQLVGVVRVEENEEGRAILKAARLLPTTNAG